MKKFMFAILALIFLGAVSSASALEPELTPIEKLGKALFFDTNLSVDSNMSCATCHGPDVGFTGPDSNINLTTAVYPGTIIARFGNRKPPSAAYGGDSPVLDDVEGLWIGGMFWDGRATGWTLGDPLAEQAQGPFLNPLEMAMPDAKNVCIKVRNSIYASLYTDYFGPFDCENDAIDFYDNIAEAIAAFERSAEVNPYSSKYDDYLAGNKKALTKIEIKGLNLFNRKGNCAACHPSTSNRGKNGAPPLFTDFSYDNLGVPKNPNNPFYSMPPKWNPDGHDWIDYGLGGFLKGADYLYESELGKQKVPTLRNVDKRPSEDFIKAYGHNGYFKSLEGIVHFYNTRDVKDVCPGAYTEAEALAADCWPASEVAENVNINELGDLRLTPAEEAAIVAFLKTLSDGYTP